MVIHLFKGDIQQTLGEGTCMEHLTVTACYVANFLVIYYASGSIFQLMVWVGGLGPGGLDICDPPYERDCYLGDPPDSNPKRPTGTTNEPSVEFSKIFWDHGCTKIFHRRTLYLTEKHPSRVPVMQGSFQRP